MRERYEIERYSRHLDYEIPDTQLCVLGALSSAREME